MSVTSNARSDTVGMTVFVLSDACTFLGVLVVYILLRVGTPGWGSGEPPFDLVTATALTVLLLASAGSLEYARRKPGQWRGGVAAAAILGTAFVLLQAWEWADLLERGLSLATSNRASAFYLLTGFHGLHVAAGVVYLAALALRRSGRPKLAAISIYWHFVDAVWLGIFLAIYVI